MKKKYFFIVLFIFTTINIFSDFKNPYKVEYWVANIRGGVSYPIGEFGNYTDPSYNFSAGVRKGLDMELTAGGSLTYATMPYKVTDAPTPFTATILDVEVAYTPYMPDFFIWPYIKAGLGVYMLKYSRLVSKDESKAESDTSFGFLFGGGAIYPLGNQFGINLEVLYNYVSLAGGTGDMNTFLLIDLGVIMYIK